MGHIRNNVIHSRQPPLLRTRPSHKKSAIAARFKKTIPPKPTKKLPPRAPAPYKAKQIFAMCRRVLLGEVLGERGRFGGREPRLSRGGSLPPRPFPPPTHQTFIGRSRVRSWIASAMCGARITSLESRSAIVRATRRMRPYPRALNPMRSYAARSRADASSST